MERQERKEDQSVKGVWRKKVYKGGKSKERATKDAGSEGKQESWTRMRAVEIWWGYTCRLLTP